LSERKEEQELVDVTTNEPIPAFDSDSECEKDVFNFNTKIRPNYSGKQSSIGIIQSWRLECFLLNKANKKYSTKDTFSSLQTQWARIDYY
jgi:hypothetical protein